MGTTRLQAVVLAGEVVRDPLLPRAVGGDPQHEVRPACRHTETGVLNIRAAGGSGSRSEAWQCEFALVV